MGHVVVTVWHWPPCGLKLAWGCGGSRRWTGWLEQQQRARCGSSKQECAAAAAGLGQSRQPTGGALLRGELPPAAAAGSHETSSLTEQPAAKAPPLSSSSNPDPLCLLHKHCGFYSLNFYSYHPIAY